MTVIVNNDPTTDDMENGDALVREFFLNTLVIDLTGKSLKLTFDALGRINEIDLDPTVSLSAAEITQVQDEFYEMSVDTIINSLGTTSESSHITTYITGLDIDIPLEITPSVMNTPIDIVAVDSWVVDVSKDFTVTDDDVGEVQYNGIVPITLPVSYTASLTTVSGNTRVVFTDIMRKPDAGSYAEVPGSRAFTDDDSNGNVKNIHNRMFIIINPLDKLKVNMGQTNGTNKMLIGDAGLTIG